MERMGNISKKSLVSQEEKGRRTIKGRRIDRRYIDER